MCYSTAYTCVAVSDPLLTVQNYSMWMFSISTHWYQKKNDENCVVDNMYTVFWFNKQNEFEHSQHLLLLAANTIIFCFCDGVLLKSLYKMAASLKDKRTPITTPPYQVPSVDVTPDPPIFSLVTTFKGEF